MNKEPEIIINGIKLSDGLSMTVRAALESFAAELETTGLGEDDHGASMTTAYLNSIDAIRSLIFKDESQPKDKTP